MNIKRLLLVFVILCGVIGGLFWGSKFINKNKPFVKVESSEIQAPSYKSEIEITNDKYLPYKDKYDIVRNTKSLGGISEKYYSKYLEYQAPNGKPIRLLAQDQVTDSQLLYAYSVLSFYLSNLSEDVANQMADNEATLNMPNGSSKDEILPEEAFIGQDLFQLETAPIGSKWYMESDYGHRDAAFEEIFHLVHDYGIGTTLSPQSNPELAKDINRATMNALPEKREDWGSKGIWANHFMMKSWLDEIEKEGSLEQEYIISVIDSYYGLWAAYKKDKGMWGGYIAKTRSDVINYDPVGYEVLDSFLPEYINGFMSLDESFEGKFSMVYDRKKPYTFKSQYLKNIYLSGSNNVEVIGNNEDNIFMGNKGENTFDGKKGNDILQLRGLFEDYTIYKEDDKIIIFDNVHERDGKISIINIEILRFTDKDLLIDAM